MEIGTAIGKGDRLSPLKCDTPNREVREMAIGTYRFLVSDVSSMESRDGLECGPEMD